MESRGYYDSLDRTADYLASVGWSDVPERALLIANGIFRKVGNCASAKETIRRVVVAAVAAARGRAAAKSRLADRRKASPPKSQRGVLLPTASSSCEGIICVVETPATASVTEDRSSAVLFQKCILDIEQTDTLALPLPSTEGDQTPFELTESSLPKTFKKPPPEHKVPVHSSSFPDMIKVFEDVTTKESIFTVHGTEDDFEDGIRRVQDTFEHSRILENGGILGRNVTEHTELFDLGEVATRTVQVVKAFKVGKEKRSKLEDLDLNERKSRRSRFQIYLTTSVIKSLMLFEDVVEAPYVVDRLEEALAERQQGVASNP